MTSEISLNYRLCTPVKGPRQQLPACPKTWIPSQHDKQKTERGKESRHGGACLKSQQSGKVSGKICRSLVQSLFANVDTPGLVCGIWDPEDRRRERRELSGRQCCNSAAPGFCSTGFCPFPCMATACSLSKYAACLGSQNSAFPGRSFSLRTPNGMDTRRHPGPWPTDAG